MISSYPLPSVVPVIALFQMSKKICKLEKETSSWKQRWEKSHQALLEMAADKQQRDGELALATRQLAQLQKLCRTLQVERTSMLAQLKAEGAAKTGGNFLHASGIHNRIIIECWFSFCGASAVDEVLREYF
jgi:hypothetical protein